MASAEPLAASPSPAPSTAAAPPTTVAGDLPSSATQRLPAHVSCADLVCAKGHISIPDTPRVDEASPVLMWTMSLPAGERAQLDAKAGLTLYGVVTAGASTADGKALPTWTGFRTTGGLILKATADAHLVLAWVSDGKPITPLLQAGQAEDLGDRPQVETVDFSSQRDLAFANGSSHVRIGFEDGPASLQVMLTSADAPVPIHTHEKAWEVIGLLTARGVFRQGPALRTTDGAASLHIPPSVTHGWAPKGDTPLLAVQLYVPPGPEQRFKTLAK